eukprot:SAG11_NODE_40906_length_199_cov_33.190000_1_plen_66_part_11
MFDELSGIWIGTEKDWVKRFVTSDVCPFLERQLIPTVYKRASEIEELTEENNEMLQEHQYLMGKYK